MGKNTVDVRTTSTAAPEAIMALLTDGASWPKWSGHDSFELVEPAPEGAPGGREGLGAVRVFHRGRVASKERVVELIPGRKLSYELLSGLPLSNYHADVELTPLPDGGTEIHWSSSFNPERRGTGWFYAMVLTTFIKRAATNLAARAAETASTG
jgi:uncharacterized protein YndB with AHSA1/START domain